MAKKMGGKKMKMPFNGKKENRQEGPFSVF
jgi:hypothetical protein